jgi:AcrR family transcriptional regulator
MARQYQMKKRATARDETRERIVRATMALHDEQGVATTSFADVAQRAGVGAATVLRHFPTVSSLVAACGQHVAAEMRPPSPSDAAEIFQGLTTTHSRLERLVNELDAFYSRGSRRLIAAANDRDRVPELDHFLKLVDAGIEAQIKEAAADEEPTEQLIGVLIALCDVSVWQRMRDAKLVEEQRRGILVDILEAAIIAVRSRRSTRSAR